MSGKGTKKYLQYMEDWDAFDDEDLYDDEDEGFGCSHCGKQATTIFCPKCYITSYCSAKCLNADKTDHQATCGEYDDEEMFGGRGKKTATNGAGYGGDTSDKSRRTAGKKQAQKRETKTWKEWQEELKTFLAKKHGTHDASSILNTLKQVLRCQAPEWWWKQPQRKMYILALQVCVVLTRDYPKAWGDPVDEESAMAALEELAQTSKLLVKQLGKDDDKKQAAASCEKNSKTDASQWFNQQLKDTPAHKNSNEKDFSLPMAVLKIRDEAAAVVKAVLEAPECSMMGQNDYYRQKLRPLAFEMVEEFETPKHFYSAGGGHNKAYNRYSYGKKLNTGGAKNKDNESSIKSSAAVLWKELSTYPTALPIEYGSSIFVRALENEMDKLRVLIIGPEDTPYANGCFLFDVTMGNDYPKAPPKVQFLTTSSFLSASDQRVRFNPNLYECGKVCLSLLGTWSGPGWSSGESTLLQVLVSLQSLILGTPDPYFNEPGYQGSEGTAHGKRASEDYNRNIRKQTLRVAILPFLQNQLRDGGSAAKKALAGKRKDPPGEDATNTTHFAEFKQVIAQHFKLKQQVIRKQLFQWLEEDKSLEALYAELWNVSDQLEEEARLNAAATSGTSRRKERRAKVDAPAVKMKDGVILLDDDDDDDFQQALVNSLATTGTAKVTVQAPKENGDGVIELEDSDDEELNSKPAANKSSDGEDGEEKKEAPPGDVAPVASLPKGDDVVDLT